MENGGKENKMNDLVSVIVPIYNTEKYVRQCIESLINQTYQNLEIILVDDGSTDSSVLICKEYQEKDNRIKLYTKENGGVSSARNLGIKNATGKYLCFCDSDDYYSNEAVSIMANTMNETNADLCCFGRYGGAFENKYISKKDNPYDLLHYLISVGSYNGISKLFKTDIIKQYNLLFDESFEIAEDTLWLREYILHSNDICLRTDKIYFVHERNGSLTRTKKKIYSKHSYYFERKLEVLKQITEKLIISEKEKENFLCERAIHGLRISSLHYISGFHNKKEACVYIQYALDWMKPWINLDEVKDKKINEWYQKNKQYIGNNNCEKIYDNLILTYHINYIKNKIGKLLGVKR